ncbi:MAG: UDP-N-acetylglucosamine diphosphorylase [Chlamydiales bacterium]|nr:UDP-N-acetylglucosamine diphosphorylase [Chlamydiales bacterium]
MLGELFDLSQFAHKGVFKGSEPWAVLSNLHNYLIQQNFLIEGEVEPGAILVNPDQISLGKGSVIEAGAYVKGPCIIGKECQIRHGAYIRGDVLTGDHCVIGHATEVKNSVFLNRSQAGHFAYVGDSVLGNRVNLGAGTKCANLRLDHQNIKVEGRDTGRRKFGALFGDGAQTGCNAVTNPGTIFEKNAAVLACATPKGIVRARTGSASHI